MLRNHICSQTQSSGLKIRIEADTFLETLQFCVDFNVILPNFCNRRQHELNLIEKYIRRKLTGVLRLGIYNNLTYIYIYCR